MWFTNSKTKSDAIDRVTSSPLTATLDISSPENIKHLITVPYNCDMNHCTILSAVRVIEQDANLKAIGCKDIVASTVHVIAENPEIFIPAQYDGFIFKLGNERVVHLRNDSLPPPSSGRTGVVSLTSLPPNIFYANPRTSDVFWNPSITGALTAPFLYAVYYLRRFRSK